MGTNIAYSGFRPCGFFPLLGHLTFKANSIANRPQGTTIRSFSFAFLHMANRRHEFYCRSQVSVDGEDVVRGDADPVFAVVGELFGGDDDAAVVPCSFLDPGPAVTAAVFADF